MQHEHAVNPERREQYRAPQPTFNLENLPPDDVAELVAMLDGPALDHEGRNRSPTSERLADIYARLHDSVRDFPDRDPRKAYELYIAMANSEHPEPRYLIGTVMDRLLEKYREPSEERQRIIDTWVALFQEATSDRYFWKQYEVAESMHEAISSDWLDKATAEYLDGQLQEGWATVTRDDKSST
jgi:hypothetical protein